MQSVRSFNFIRTGIAFLMATLIASPAFADQREDQELGQKYVDCSVLSGYVNQATPSQGPTKLMLALGAHLLGKTTATEIKPNLDIANQKLTALINSSTEGKQFFDPYSECMQLHAARSQALVDRFKAEIIKKDSPANATATTTTASTTARALTAAPVTNTATNTVPTPMVSTVPLAGNNPSASTATSTATINFSIGNNTALALPTGWSYSASFIPSELAIASSQIETEGVTIAVVGVLKQGAMKSFEKLSELARGAVAVYSHSATNRSPSSMMFETQSARGAYIQFISNNPNGGLTAAAGENALKATIAVVSKNGVLFLFTVSQTKNSPMADENYRVANEAVRNVR